MEGKIIENARADGYEVLGAGEYDKLYTKVSVRITPFEWAELFKHAEYVYTGTFHGVVFSILHAKTSRFTLLSRAASRKSARCWSSSA
jgi:hypothetical protein